MAKLVWSHVQKRLKELGIKVTRTQQGSYNYEYRIAYVGCSKERQEATAYYTTDLEDAYHTGLDMWKRGTPNKIVKHFGEKDGR